MQATQAPCCLPRAAAVLHPRTYHCAHPSPGLQPFDLRHFPFDSMDLLLTLEFLDTSSAGHPGVRVRARSAVRTSCTRAWVGGQGRVGVGWGGVGGGGG